MVAACIFAALAAYFVDRQHLPPSATLISPSHEAASPTAMIPAPQSRLASSTLFSDIKALELKHYPHSANYEESVPWQLALTLVDLGWSQKVGDVFETLAKCFPDQEQEMSFKLCERYVNLALNINGVEMPTQECLEILDLTETEFSTIAARHKQPALLHTMMERVGISFNTSSTRSNNFLHFCFLLIEKEKYLQADLVLRSQTPDVLEVPFMNLYLPDIQKLLSDRFLRPLESEEFSENASAVSELENLETISLLWTLLSEPGDDCPSSDRLFSTTMPQFSVLLTKRVLDLPSLDPCSVRNLCDLVQRCFQHVIKAKFVPDDLAIVTSLIESIQLLINSVQSSKKDLVSVLVYFFSHCDSSSISQRSWNMFITYPSSLLKSTFDGVEGADFRRAYFNWALSSPQAWLHWGHLSQSDSEWVNQQQKTQGLQSLLTQEKLDVLREYLETASKDDAPLSFEISTAIRGWVTIQKILPDSLSVNAIASYLQEKMSGDPSFRGLLDWIMKWGESILAQQPSLRNDLLQWAPSFEALTAIMMPKTDEENS
jgi:hypothetical protein